MPTIHIDNQIVEVPDGATILDAARKLGIDIPALCWRDGCDANTTCMACVVRVEGRAALVPSCATPAADGMRVESESDDVRSVRRTALELLLSDHLGDCMAPCHSTCPARMDIPKMLRQIAAGRMPGAIETVKADIALPAVLGRICPAPCEKPCRRAQHDAPVTICMLKRHVADVDLASPEPYMPPRGRRSGKTVAVVGAGPTGLSAAYYLLAAGHDCVIFDDRQAPGGQLRYGVGEDALDRAVLDAEIGIIRKMGASLRPGVRVGRDLPLAELRRDYAAVLVATGATGQAAAAELGLDWDGSAVRYDRTTHVTTLEGVFAACSARQQKMAVRAVADGKSAAAAIGQFLAGQAVVGAAKPFTVHIGKVEPEELRLFMAAASDTPRREPGDIGAGYAPAEAVEQAARCMHCDCRRPGDCKLRIYSAAYGASASAYKAGRRTFEQHFHDQGVIFEPGKCIDCGLCVQITRRAGERYGLAFVGRGFNVRVVVPMGKTLSEGLVKAAAECAAACPTGALAMRDKEEEV
jgi:ferredoxin